MLKVDRYEHIRREHIVNRKSINKLAKEYHHSKRTIRKILDNITPPGYRRMKPIPMPVLGPVKDWIEDILETDRTKPKKQRHTARRIYNRLVKEKKYSGCESNVRKFVREWKRNHKEVEGYIRLSYEPGIDAQVDFGEALAIISGREETVHILSLRQCYSSKSVQVGLPGETQECLFEGLRRIFEEMGGVPRTIWFDNLPAAVSKVLRGRNRTETDNFIGFRSHYLFEVEFCGPGKGNEKGHAENLVGYGRRNFMVPIPEVADYDELNKHLLISGREDEDRNVHGHTVGFLFEQERAKLLPLPSRPHNCRVHRKVRVNKFQEVEHSGKRYSVPLKYIGRDVWLHVGAFDIEIEYDHKIIAKKQRCYGIDESGIDPFDYLDTLERKTRAVGHAKVLKDWNLPVEFQEIHQSLKRRYPGVEGDREYVKILKLFKEFDSEIVEVAVSLAVDYQSIQAESVKSLCYQLISRNTEPPVIDVGDRNDSIRGVHSWRPDLSVYNRFLAGAE